MPVETCLRCKLLTIAEIKLGDTHHSCGCVFVGAEASIPVAGNPVHCLFEGFLEFYLVELGVVFTVNCFYY